MEVHGYPGYEELAGAAISFLEALASHRAGGLEARVRTQARCGGNDTYAFSMIGSAPSDVPTASWITCNAMMQCLVPPQLSS